MNKAYKYGCSAILTKLKHKSVPCDTWELTLGENV